METTNTKERILKGISLLENIKTSQWTQVHTLWVKKLIYLMKDYLVEENVTQAEKIFGSEEV